jgi:TRAP-type mannitol/chloroaromatic compound transport system permease small subunit
MNILFRFSNFLDRMITKVGIAAAWMAIPLIAVIIFDVITRRFLVLGSTKLQEMEWHLHTILFALCLGYAYLRDSHVRIELVRERLSQRAKWWIEFLGCLLFLIPYCTIVLYHGSEWWGRSFSVGEDSDSATGLPFRWIIKMALPLGFVFLLLATFAIFLRKIIQLFGPSELRDKVTAIENKKSEHLDNILPTDEPLKDKGAGQ